MPQQGLVLAQNLHTGMTFFNKMCICSYCSLQSKADVSYGRRLIPVLNKGICSACCIHVGVAFTSLLPTLALTND